MGGYNLTANPGMKLIAVDPSVIPLGSRVYVEGYGEAIAADTGGAIKGHKIDVLMPDKASSSKWGRKMLSLQFVNTKSNFTYCKVGFFVKIMLS